MVPKSIISNSDNAIQEYLARFPSIEKLINEKYPNILTEMKNRIENTLQQLKRVIRQGTQEDAKRAEKVGKACEITLALLNELEIMQKDQSPQ